MYGTINYTGGLPTTGYRLVLEAIGAALPLTATTRLAVEVIGSTDTYSPSDSRLAVEVIGSNDSRLIAETRLVLEVMHDAYIGPAILAAQDYRLTAEVIAAASLYATAHSEAGRMALEVIGGADLQTKGLTFPAIALTSFSLLTLIDPASWAAGGQYAVYDALDRAVLRVYGDNTTSTVVLASTTGSVSGTFATPAGPYRLTVRSGATPGTASIRMNASAVSLTPTGTWNGWAPLRLNGSAAPEFAHSGQIAELMLYDHELDLPEVQYLESYLLCKWITPGCNPKTDLGPPP